MSTPAEEFIPTCFDEFQLKQRFWPYVQRAEEAGYPQLAKTFRALVACETTREALFRQGVPQHAAEGAIFMSARSATSHSI